MTGLFLVACLGAVNWQHPAGVITNETIAEIQSKLASQAWAREIYESRKRAVAPWMAASSEQLAQVFPKRRGNVYHNFSCPDDRTRLEFDAFNPRAFHCKTCNKDFAPDTDAGIYRPDDLYHGTMYDGWACLFYLTAPGVARDLALMGRIDNDEGRLHRAQEILRLFADTIEKLPTVNAGQGDTAKILTYNREGESKVCNELAEAYELARHAMTPDERKRFEDLVLNRFLADVMVQPEYTFDHNNVYQFHRTVLQAALALEREDLIDWSFGYGACAADRMPEHRSLQRILAKHFKADGAFWELCSGYHLYPLDALCDLAVLSHNLSRMDAARFPAAQYDLTAKDNPGGKVIKSALEWFMSMAMPDRTMTTVGDSMAPRAGMDDYATTAEVGYRYFDVRAVGDYESLRKGKRSWTGFLYGVPEIVQFPTPFTSSCLSSGWVSLRNEWDGDRVWVGLNALVPGGGHQHADRLTLTRYSHGKLLALEKATPYNDSVTRELGTLSQSHNTVTVDMTSQNKGASLKPESVPEVACFVSGPFLKFAELRADHMYPQTTMYRRSVAVIEDMVIDVFRVVGGKTHDWIVNHAGKTPTLSAPAEPSSFEPAAWLAHGTDHVLRAAPAGDWTASWSVDDVTSRLTMLGARDTQVYAIETYPIDNAIVTPGHPACQTLCVRRTNDAPFIAVWDAWRDKPNLESVAGVGETQALLLKTRGSTYYILLGPGTAVFPDGVTLSGDAAFSVFRNRDAMAYVAGTRLDVTCPEGQMSIKLSENASMWTQWPGGVVNGDKTQNIEYDTYGGEDHRRQSAVIAITFDGNLMRAK